MTDSEEKVGTLAQIEVKKADLEEKLTNFESEVLSFTSIFQKYRNFVMVFVISMPIHCVILEVEVIFLDILIEKLHNYSVSQ